jgi:uracil phosphoribosyltransferase
MCFLHFTAAGSVPETRHGRQFARACERVPVVRGGKHVAEEFPTVTVVAHALVSHKLALLRDRSTGTALFRQLTRELAILVGIEATRDLALEPCTVRTPLETATGERLADGSPCIVSILRAGNGMLDGMLALMPQACAGHIGLFRDEQSLSPVEYYLKLPTDIGSRSVIAVDPMLATGGSAVKAMDRLKQAGATRLRFACLIAAPEGLRRLVAAHPDVAVFTAAIDRELDERGYIRPGLGDAGDRYHGTE